MNRFVRVQSVRKDEPTISERLTLDLMIDIEDKAIGKFPTFGYLGRAVLNTPWFEPFTVLPDGTILNSHSPEEPDQNDERLNIIGKTIRVGEQFTYFQGNEEYLYTVKKVTDFKDMIK